MLLLFCVCFVDIARAGTKSPDWTRDAVRLTGESDFVRDTALGNLRRLPGLSQLMLREVGGPRRALALDVISALKLRSLLPSLLQNLKTDDDGQICLTIDSLVTEKNLKLVAKTYREHLFCENDCHEPDPPRLVMLEALGLMGEELNPEQLKNVFTTGSYELKSAVLRYTRHRLVNTSRSARKPIEERYLPIVLLALKTQPYQIRLQALYLVREFNLKGSDTSINSLCKTESRPEIVDFCRSSGWASK